MLRLEVGLALRKPQIVSFLFNLTDVKDVKVVVEWITVTVELAEDQESLQILCVLMDGAMEILVKLHVRYKLPRNHN